MNWPLELAGISASSRALHDELHIAAHCDVGVLITGESGVGKEAAARTIHQCSGRGQAPLATINCAGVPETFLAPELFGLASGTLLMDEVGELTLPLQSEFLSFLEDGGLRRAGSVRKASMDVRVIATANSRLLEQVAAGQFRDDLFYRLNVIHLRIVPLRERREDIPLLFDYFVLLFSQRYGVPVPRFAADAMAALCAFAWPGNVRQIRNVAERLVVRARGGVTGADELLPDLSVTDPSIPLPRSSADSSAAVVSRHHALSDTTFA
jgi:DNA-binding NtrC family response regulator